MTTTVPTALDVDCARCGTAGRWVLDTGTVHHPDGRACSVPASEAASVVRQTSKRLTGATQEPRGTT